MAILCHRWWPLQESVFFALEGEPVLDAGHALYCSTYYSRAVSVARSHTYYQISAVALTVNYLNLMAHCLFYSQNTKVRKRSFFLAKSLSNKGQNGCNNVFNAFAQYVEPYVTPKVINTHSIMPCLNVS
jgi:hypothetical protein